MRSARLQCLGIILLGVCLGASFASESHSVEAPAESHTSEASNQTETKTVYTETSMEPIANGMCPGLGAYRRIDSHVEPVIGLYFLLMNIVCPGKVASDIIGFLVLGLTALYIGISNSQYKGHR
jgi:hypothetical protein